MKSNALSIRILDALRSHFAWIFSCAALLASPAKAQFTDATVPQIPVGVTCMTQNTGNDIQDISNKTYEVSVWDDTQNHLGGFAWRVGQIYTGWTPISTPSGADMVDPDVCLLKTATTIFALIAYHEPFPVNEFKIDVYQWIVASNTFSYHNTLTAVQDDYGTSLNIDANANGDFALVWDNPGGQVNMVTGHTLSGQFPTLDNPGIPLFVTDGTSPDLSMFYTNLGGGIDINQVSLTYINLNGRVAVDLFKFDELVMGIAFPSTAYISPPADFAFHYPRIAAPNESTFYSDDWTVVVEDNDGSSTWYIKSINHRIGAWPETVYTTYNDGFSFNSPFNTSDVPNERPVLCYDYNYSTLWVGWTIDNSTGLIPSGGAPIGRYPVGLVCSRNSRIISTFNYFLIPAISVPNPDFGYLSMAGRGSTKGLFTFHEGPMFDIYTKTVPHLPLPSSFRASGPEDLNEWLTAAANGLVPGAETSACTLELFDPSGRRVLVLHEKGRDMAAAFAASARTLPASLYLGRLYSDDGQVTRSGKLMAGRE